MIQLSSRFHRNKEDNNLGTIRYSNYKLELNKITNAVNDLLINEFKDTEVVSDDGNGGNNDDIKKDNGNGGSDDLPIKKSVFISYSHKESNYALKMKASLELQDIDVIIDAEDNVAGSQIESFIEQSIKKTSNTVSIISLNSLLSA
jgi:hypothetical protein